MNVAVRDVDFVKKIIIKHNKRIFRLKTIERLYGVSIQSMRLVVPVLVRSDFIRIYNRNGRYTLYERVKN